MSSLNDISRDNHVDPESRLPSPADICRFIVFPHPIDMQIADVLPLKRASFDYDNQTKRVKREDVKIEDTGDAILEAASRKPQARGVERIFPLPKECRLSERYHDWYRRVRVT